MSTDTILALTTRQNEILEFIRHALSTRGVPPTREEIARAFGFRSLNASEQHLQALQRKGLIELLAGTSRGIRLKGGTQDSIGAAAREFGLPLIGKVAAGSPILAQENVLKHPVVDAALFKPRADYLLEVRGMSMRDAGILDGDWLAVHRQEQALNGQIVVARLGDEVTVKRFRLKGSRAELIAENPDYAPILVDLKREALAIEGLAVGVIRPSLYPIRRSIECGPRPIRSRCCARPTRPPCRASGTPMIRHSRPRPPNVRPPASRSWMPSCPAAAGRRVN